MFRPWWQLLVGCVVVCVGTGMPGFGKAVLSPDVGSAATLKTTAVTVRARVNGQFANVEETLTFANESDRRMEATFLYELPPDAAATYFAYWFGAEKVEAVIVERERAQQIYTAITTVRRDPALVEMVDERTFRVRIFPVMPNADLKVELHYVQALPTEDGTDAVLALPLGDGNGASLDKLDAVVRVTGDADITDVTNNYGMPVTREGTDYAVTVNAAKYAPPGDLHVRVKHTATPLRAASYSAYSDSPDGYFALALTASRALAKPQVTIDGVSTSALLPALPASVAAGQTFFVFGRYTGSGMATVTVTEGGNKGTALSAKVDLRPVKEPDNMAVKLWGARRLVELGKDEATREEATNLSFDLCMPCAFTSWLAIPAAERQRFLNQIAWTNAGPQKQRYTMAVLYGKTDPATLQQYRAELVRTLTRNAGSAFAKTEMDSLDASLKQQLDSMTLQTWESRYLDAQAAKPSDPTAIAWLRERVVSAAEKSYGTAGVKQYMDELGMRVAQAQQQADIARYNSAVQLGIQDKAAMAQMKAASEKAMVTLYGPEQAHQARAEEKSRQAQERVDAALERYREVILNPEDPGQIERGRIEAVRVLTITLGTATANEEVAKVAAMTYAERAEGDYRAESQKATPDAARVAALRQTAEPLLVKAYGTKEASRRLASDDYNAAESLYTAELRKANPQPQALAKLRTDLENALALYSPTTNVQQQITNLETQIANERRSTAQNAYEQEMQKPTPDPVAVKRLRSDLLTVLQRTMSAEEAAKTVNGLDEQQAERRYSYALYGYEKVPAGDLTRRRDELLTALTATIGAEQAKAQVEAMEAKAKNDVTKQKCYEWQRQALETYSAEAMKDAPDSTRLARLREVLTQALATTATSEQIKTALLNDDANIAQQKYYTETYRENPRPAMLRELRATLEQAITAQQGPVAAKQALANVDKWAAANQARSSYFSEQWQAHPDPARLQTLLDETNDPNNYRAARETAYLAAQGEASHMEWMIEHARNTHQPVPAEWLAEKARLDTQTWYMRPGDPLIKVHAPADAKQVVAVLPDGTPVPLAWVAADGLWEGRFDIPAGMTSGTYDITINVVADGQRSTFTIPYTVDTTPPTGVATVVQVTEPALSLRLTVDASADTARVTALLPWGERVELRAMGAEGHFFLVAPAPATWHGGAGSVRFVLTDCAHNKADVVAEAAVAP